MKKICFAVLLAFMALRPAQATDDRAILPPPEYDHPYTGELLIIEVEKQQTLIDNCPTIYRNKPPNTPAIACTIRHEKSCVVLIASKDQFPWFQMIHKSYSYENVLRHEIGHCNGWPGDHPNSVYDPAYDDR